MKEGKKEQKKILDSDVVRTQVIESLNPILLVPLPLLPYLNKQKEKKIGNNKDKKEIMGRFSRDILRS